jgi:hypothetical protein
MLESDGPSILVLNPQVLDEVSATICIGIPYGFAFDRAIRPSQRRKFASCVPHMYSVRLRSGPCRLRCMLGRPG